MLTQTNRRKEKKKNFQHFAVSYKIPQSPNFCEIFVIRSLKMPNRYNDDNDNENESQQYE